MSFAVQFLAQRGYLHAVVTGPNIKENVSGYLAEVLRECQSRRVDRVLIEERLEGPRLGMVDVFDIAADGGGRIGGALDAIAYVDVFATDGAMKFAETVAVNRGAPVRMFGTVAEAERWLSRL